MTDIQGEAAALRRSVLYLPAANPRALDKARSLPADVLVFDLEDAVAPERKVAARAALLEALAAGGYGDRELVVRINAPETPWYEEDVIAVARSGAHALCLPKVEAVADVQQTLARLNHAGAPASLSLWAMAETPRGVLSIREIAGCHARLDVIMVGTSDLTRDLRARHTGARDALLFALSRCVMAAREHGLDVIDGVHLDLEDDAGLAAACIQGRDLGFDGKSLIHPRQIAAANAAFAPSAGELAQARAIVAAWAEARERGQGVLVLDGRLVESLHVAEAERLLRLQQLIDARGG